jgi:hypothetical protein
MANTFLVFQKDEIYVIHDWRVLFLTDLEGKDDRLLNRGSQEHYSKAVTKVSLDLFGTEGVYRDLEKARSVIKMVVQVIIPDDSTHALSDDEEKKGTTVVDTKSADEKGDKSGTGVISVASRI